MSERDWCAVCGGPCKDRPIEPITRKPGTDGDHTFDRRTAIEDADDEKIAAAIELLCDNDFRVEDDGPKAREYFERRRLRSEREKR